MLGLQVRLTQVAAGLWLMHYYLGLGGNGPTHPLAGTGPAVWAFVFALVAWHNGGRRAFWWACARARQEWPESVHGWIPTEGNK